MLFVWWLDLPIRRVFKLERAIFWKTFQRFISFLDNVYWNQRLWVYTLTPASRKGRKSEDAEMMAGIFLFADFLILRKLMFTRQITILYHIYYLFNKQLFNYNLWKFKILFIKNLQDNIVGLKIIHHAKLLITKPPRLIHNKLSCIRRILDIIILKITCQVW